MSSTDGQLPSVAPKVVVATTVALSFISFWRGASIVLSDLASSAFYAGGAAEQAVGKSAPWFVLGVMLFSFAVRSVYMESCSMFVRGGVYVVVRDSMGPILAKFSVSSLVFDYILTGPISVVSAGLYLAALLNEISELLHSSYRINVNLFAAGLRRVGDYLFLVAKPEGRPRIERQGAAHHADHHGDGGDPDDLVSTDDSIEGPLAQSSSRPDRLQSQFCSRSARLVQGNFLDPDPNGGDHYRVRPLAAFDERI